MSDSNMVSGYEVRDGDGNQPAGSDIPLFFPGMDTITWRNSIFRWAMSKRGGAHKALNPEPKKEAFWINKSQPMMKSELASFQSARREYWAHSCYIYSCLENSFKGNHPAREYYLMLHQRNLDAGVTEFFEASKLLDDICTHFKDTSETTKTKLTLEFSSFLVKAGETVEVYATRFERLVQSLGLVNVKSDDAVLQATFKAGLVGQEFIFVQTLLTMTTYATFELMKTAVIMYSKSAAAVTLRTQAQEIANADTAVATSQTTAEANLTTEKRARSPYTGCFVCSSKKHKAAECPQREGNSEPDDDDESPPRVKKRKGVHQEKRSSKKGANTRKPILSLVRDGSNVGSRSP
jgi:hypothetical protein